MMKGIDFTDMPKRNKTYAGANGSKIGSRTDTEAKTVGKSRDQQERI